jgi:titin
VASTNFDYAAKTILISWSAPTSNGGAAISDYVIEYSGSTNGPWTAFPHTASTATSITVTGLSGLPATYVFRVAAVNAAGTGTASTPTTLMVLVKPETTGGSADNA